MNSFDWHLIWFQLVIVIPFLAGSVLRRRFSNHDDLGRKIVIVNLLLFEPPVILWSIWGLELRGEMFLLPLAGLTMVMAGFCLGKLTAPLLIPEIKYRKVFVISASLANHGFTMGGVICYVLLGEKGLALAAIFITYFIPFTFLFIFFYAGSGLNSRRINLDYILKFFFNLRNMPLLAVGIAILLRLAGVERPAIQFPVSAFLAVSISLYYFTLGINFELGDLRPLQREHGLMAGIKFVLIPVGCFAILQGIDVSADIRKVILTESFMPAAVYSVITSVLFNLDTRLASSLFFVNTMAFLFILLPLFFYFF